MSRLSVGSAVSNSVRNLQRNIDDFLSGRTNVLVGVRNPETAKRLFAQKRQSQQQRQQQLSSGVTPGTTVETLPQTTEEAVANANRLNEERFEEGRRLFDEQKTNAAQLGATQRTDLVERLNRNNAVTDQSLISRGLFNPVTSDALRRGNRSDFNRDSIALEESLLSSRNRILGEEIGFIERRTDAAIDPALFASLERDAAGAITGTPSLSGGGGSGGGAAGDIAGTGATDFAGRPVFNTITSPGDNQAAEFAAREAERRAAEAADVIAPVTFVNLTTGRPFEVTSKTTLAQIQNQPDRFATPEQFSQIQAEKEARENPLFDIRNRNTGRTFQARQNELAQFQNKPDTFLIIGPSTLNA